MNRWLLGISLVYVLLALGYSFSVPLWEAPDEPAHFLYVNHFAVTGQPHPPVPPQRSNFWKEGFVTSGYEWRQPPLDYALASLVLRIVRWSNLVPRFTVFPEVDPSFPNSVRLFVPDPPRFSEVHILRGLSILWGLGTIWVVYGMVRAVAPQTPDAAVLASGFVAFLPQFIFLHSYVSNDPPAIFLASLAFAVLLRIPLSPPSARQPIWILAGAATGLAMITKLTTWSLIPVAVALAILLVVTCLSSVRQALMGLFLYGLLALSALGLSWLIWPDLHIRLLYREPGLRPQVDLGYVLGLFPLTHSSFWGRFGWMNLPLPGSFYLVLDALGLVGWFGAGLAFLRRPQSWPIAQRLILVLALFAVGVQIVLFLLFNFTVRQPQGRLLFTVLPAIALLFALGWSHLAGPRIRPAKWTILGILLVMDLYSLLRVFLPTYAL